MAAQQHTPDGFVSALEDALEHFADPAWIGANSPLAAPYFLGEALAHHGNGDATARGAGFQGLLRSAAKSLGADQQKLLSASFLDRNWNLNINGVAMKLDMSRAAYYRHRATTLVDLARAFSSLISPALRGEAVPPAQAMGREAELTQALTALRECSSISIGGPSGLGKTAFGAAIAGQWNTEQVFWYTLRPPLNDQLASFVFALAHFLQGRGAKQTWQQLVADRGELKTAQLLGLLRHDLSSLKQPVLLCIDEVDQLRLELAGHAQLAHLLEDLQAICPMLLIGQQSLVEARVPIQLKPLALDTVKQLLSQADAPKLSAKEMHQVLTIVRGHPALLHLFLIFARISGNVGEAIAQLRSAASMEMLLARIWRYLSVDERGVLAALAVFRTSAPRDAWATEAPLIQSLLQRDLVIADGRGGLSVPEQVRGFALQQSPAEMRQALHLQAARIYEARADHTAAAYHYLQGRQSALAVWVWYAHREREIEQGRAAAAREIFRDVTLAELPNEDDRRAFALLQAEWARLTGQTQEALNALNDVTWPSDHAATGYAQRLRGALHEMQGQIEQALQAFRTGLRALDQQAQGETTRLHVSIGYSHFRQREMDAARQAALNAQITAQEFRGYIEMQAGNYAQARADLEQALALAQSSSRTPRELHIRVYERLGALAWQMGQPEQTIEFCNTAIRFLNEKGDSVAVLYQRMNLAAAYIMLGQHRQALDETQAGMDLAQAIGHGYLVAGLAVNAAEACLGLNQLDEAERFAQLALTQEEDSTQPYAMTLLGMAQHQRGQPAKAEATLRFAAQAAGQIEDRYAEANALRELGRVLGAMGQQDAAGEALGRAIHLFDEMGLGQEVEKTRALIPS